MVDTRASKACGATRASSSLAFGSMKRQVPPIVFYGIVAVALLAVVQLLTKPGNPQLHKGALVGQPAPAIEGKTPEGKKVSLSDYKGKVVLVNFWATWCGPCKQEIPTLVELQKKYGAQGFEILGLVSNDDMGKAMAFAKSNEMTWPQLSATPEIGGAYGIRAIPASFIVNRKGEVAASIEGLIAPELLEDEVKAHL